MADYDRLRTAYQDLSNDVAWNLVYLKTGVTSGQVDDGRGIIVDLTRCHIMSVTREATVYGPDVASGASGAYGTVDDMVTVEFDTSAGGKWPITVVGPLSSLFLGDDVTLNPGNASVADFVTWCLTYCCTKSGATLTEYSRGWRW